MIYTFTPNPSLDYIMETPRINLGGLNRSKREWVKAGGKGLNVSQVLASLGADTKVLTITAGDNGKRWIRLVERMGIKLQTVHDDNGDTRVNVKLIGVEQTEINAIGPNLSDECVQPVYDMFDQIEDGDILVISGKRTPNRAADSFACIMDLLKDKDVKVVVDSSGEEARIALSRHPFFIKPNVDELEEIGNTSIDSEADIISCCDRLIKMGAQNALVSMGKDGAIWIGGNGFVYKAYAPEGRVKNTVGSGDSMLAAFLFGYTQGLEIEECVRLAVAAGSAGAFSDNLPTKEQVYDILNQVKGQVIRPAND